MIPCIILKMHIFNTVLTIVNVKVHELYKYIYSETSHRRIPLAPLKTKADIESKKKEEVI